MSMKSWTGVDSSGRTIGAWRCLRCEWMQSVSTSRSEHISNFKVGSCLMSFAISCYFKIFNFRFSLARETGLTNPSGL